MLFFRREERYILDSSSIIDGRVVNLFHKKFLEGKIIIPYLVRTIARRKIGADADKAINNLRKITSLEFIERNIDGVTEELLVLRIAERRKAKVITTSDEFSRYLKSFPLVRLLNIKELYSILTPIFSPNKIITVRILKRGQNPNEGVGYIEGVKIIVSDGAKFINQVVMAKVDSMLQFESGNLVFASLIDRSQENLPEENRKELENGRT